MDDAQEKKQRSKKMIELVMRPKFRVQAQLIVTGCMAQ